MAWIAGVEALSDLGGGQAQQRC